MRFCTVYPLLSCILHFTKQKVNIFSRIDKKTLDFLRSQCYYIDELHEMTSKEVEICENGSVIFAIKRDSP